MAGMIRLLVFFLCILGVCPAAIAAMDKATAQQLLVSAARRAALLEDAPQPFELDVKFTAMINTPRQGHLKLRWEAKDRWWSKVTLEPFEQVKIKNGERSYTLRNTDFTPLRIQDLFELLDVGKHYDRLVVKKDRQRVEDGLTLDCMEVQTQRDQFLREICVDSATGSIVSDTQKMPREKDSLLHRAHFSEFAEFEGHRYPRRLELLEDGKPLVTAEVEELKEARPLGAQLTTPPRGAIERRECEDEKPPAEIGQWDLHVDAFFIPKGTRVSVSVTVLADGSVDGIHVLESGGAALDSAVVDSIRGLKFKPAMCGSDPVDADYRMTVNRE